MESNRRHNLKRRLFERDGWQDSCGTWHVMCAFGCGDELVWATATIDRYPVMGQHGGTYIYENTRLACKPCNSSNRNHKEPRPDRPTRRDKKAARKQLRFEHRLNTGKLTKADRKAMLAENYQMLHEGPSDARGNIRMDF